MTAYRLWPSTNGAGTATAYNGGPIGMQFSLSSQQPLTGIWVWSPSGATQMPTTIGVYAVTGASLVPGSKVTSPSWSGAAGSGWIMHAYNGSVLLAASTNYKIALFNSGSGTWYSQTSAYWTTGAGASGITNGPITAPNNASASPGQDSYAGGSAFGYPSITAAGVHYWMDVQVGLTASGNALLAAGMP